MEDVKEKVKVRMTVRLACADSGISYEIGDLWVFLEPSGGIVIEEVRSGAQVSITSSLRGGLEVSTNDQIEPTKLGGSTELRIYPC